MKRISIAGLVLSLVGFLNFAVFASDVTIPNTFTAGTTASAAQVNANFAAVETAVDDNDARLDTLGPTVSSLSSTVTSLSSTVSSLSSSVGSLQSSVTSLSNSVSSLSTTVTTVSRSATTALPSTSLPATYTSLGSVTINAPASGYVLVITSGTMQLNSKAVGNYSSIYVGVSNSSTTMSSNNYTRFYLSADVSAGSYEIPFTAHGLFAVSAGNNSFYTLAREDGPSGSGAIYHGRITAVFLRY